ncbi:MAG: hypothetical protein EOO91_02010 [Pedobacter sp.]|nr:MAG: hypothetical protein EOO91_02010 [Pedobacter sp.]
MNDLLEGVADVKAQLFALEMTKAKVDNLHTLFFKSVQMAERNALKPCERVELEIKERTTQLFLEDLNKINQM